MTQKRASLSQRYHAGLQQFLKQGPGASTEPAQSLGQLAVDSGLETRYRPHPRDRHRLPHPPDLHARNQWSSARRAAAFFTATLVPIERTHRGAIEANIHLNHTIKALGQRTDELAESVSELKLEILQRIEAEQALKISELTTSALLVKSLEMQDELRYLSRQLLSVQEEERRKISRELHDVIAQSLCSINFRLALLKTESAISRKMLGKNREHPTHGREIRRNRSSLRTRTPAIGS